MNKTKYGKLCQINDKWTGALVLYRESDIVAFSKEKSIKCEGFMNTLQSALLEMMHSVHLVCKEKRITYYMMGGTMLGAIRHEGFIPWDDDIDIIMPRKDFELFIKIKSTELPEWMEIVSPNRGVVNMGYAKVVNKNTTLVEDYKGIRVGGVFIDVFPLDGIADTRKAALLRFKRIKLKTFMLRSNQSLSDEGSFLRKTVAFVSKRFPTEKLYENYCNEINKKDYYSCEFVANTVGVYGTKELMDKRVFGVPTLYKFEKYEFYGVERSDEYLKAVYGDYMKLPPLEERISQHGIIYLDLNQPYREYLKLQKGSRVEQE